MRCIFCLFVFVCGLNLFSQQLVFDTEFFDLGDLTQGDHRQFAFSYQNQSDSDTVVIIDVLPQCGCTSIEFSQRTVKSLQEGVLRFEFDTEGKEGYLRKTITVLLKGSSPIVLVFTANVIISEKKVKGKTIR